MTKCSSFETINLSICSDKIKLNSMRNKNEIVFNSSPFKDTEYNNAINNPVIYNHDFAYDLLNIPITSKMKKIHKKVKNNIKTNNISQVNITNLSFFANGTNSILYKASHKDFHSSEVIIKILKQSLLKNKTAILEIELEHAILSRMRYY